MNETRQIGGQRSTPAGPGFAQANPFFGLLPREYARRKKDFFTYNIRFNPLAAGGTATQTANVQNDSDFVWTHGTVIITGTTFLVFTLSTAIPVLVELTDSASGVQLQDSQTHASNLFGTAQLPFMLPFPKIFRAGGQISIRAQNQDGVNAWVLNFAFHGFKCFFMDA